MPHVEIPQAEFKVVILGDSHIGKTSLVTRFAEGYYRENSRPATVGAFFVTKRIQSSENVSTKIQIWDTAGQENFHVMAPMFYKNAAAVIVCYDVTRRDSFEGMRKWLDEVRRKVKVGEEVVVAIAALKTDLLQDENNAVVPEHEVEQLAEALGVLYLPTSAKTNRNVQALFQCVADRVLQLRTTAGENIVAMNGDNAATGGGAMANGNHESTNHNMTQSERIKMVSPRKRDQFDKYYVSQNGDMDDKNKSQRQDGSTKEKDTSQPTEKSRRPSKLLGAGRKKSRSGGSTPSTDGTATEEDSHPLIADSKKERKKKGRGTKEGAIIEENSYCLSCGAADGSSGCTIQ